MAAMLPATVALWLGCTSVPVRVGHSSPIVTQKTYTHVVPTSDEQAATVIAVLGVRS